MATDTGRKPLDGMQLGEFFDHEGLLAQYRGGWVLQDRPARVDRIAVATRLRAEDYPWLLGRKPWVYGTPTWSGTVSTAMGGTMRVSCDDWPTREVETGIPAPRDSKDYTWAWGGSFAGWIRDYFPRCSECYRYHHPAWSHCEECGNGARALDKRGYCARCRKAMAERASA